VLIEQQTAVHRSDFPYVPGYLFFREGQAIVDVLRSLKQFPDVVLIDGQGIAHPRGIGSASHIGLLLDIPTIGCAKTRLVGNFQEPGKQKGSWSLLEYNGKATGAVVLTQDGIKPIFVSPGHKIDVSDSIRVLLGSIGRYRIPEPLRCAHMLSRKARQQAAVHE
jgi:deoxyribonuclease V